MLVSAWWTNGGASLLYKAVRPQEWVLTVQSIKSSHTAAQTSLEVSTHKINKIVTLLYNNVAYLHLVVGQPSSKRT